MSLSQTEMSRAPAMSPSTTRFHPSTARHAPGTQTNSSRCVRNFLQPPENFPGRQGTLPQSQGSFRRALREGGRVYRADGEKSQDSHRDVSAKSHELVNEPGTASRSPDNAGDFTGEVREAEHGHPGRRCDQRASITLLAMHQQERAKKS